MFRINTFHELLKGLLRGVFDGFVTKHNAAKYCKRFGSWDHLVAILYAPLGWAYSIATR